MSLTLALNTALSGLRTTQGALSVISNNVSNANTDGYTRKVVQTNARTLAGVGAGVELSGVVRTVDSRVQADAREATTKLQALEVKEMFLTSVQNLYGSPGDESTVGHTISALAEQVDSLGATPESATVRSQTINAAQNLVSQIGDMSSSLQDLRRDADRQISDAVDTVNTQLKRIADLNAKIKSNAAQDIPTGDLEDERDKALSTLTQQMDVTSFVRSDGSLSVYTKSGVLLADSTAATLTHTAVTAMSPAMSLGAGIDGIQINGTDITGSITGGTIAGLVDLRDSTLPDMQSELDRLTEQLRDQLNEIHNQGTGLPPASSLTGSRSFATPSTDSVTLTSATRIAVLDDSGVVVSSYDLPAGTYTVDQVRNAINTNLAGSATATTAAGGPLAISADSSPNGIAIVDLGTQTVTDGTNTINGFSNYFGLNDFFQTPGNVEGDAITGISQLLQVRSDLASDPSLLSRGQLTDAATAPVAGDTGVAFADNRIALALGQRFDKTVTFAAAGGIAATGATLSGYGAEIVAESARVSANNSADYDYQSTLQQQLDQQQKSLSGVNIDEEMSNLVVFQNAYAASAKVITTAQAMFDALSNLIR
ncbi:flagellar hook-associated protein 1 FlgK [Tistlia consotensis]|uniref:Flagellar hook-associated protein 1 n=1 Tax=Tistlia consotensis USBA 355 TaxID=560819 RepID=A0A1Y6CP36_9PROT|nr:flagellar hook-associated protein FlgK [Tistlia consotensis]SMF67854.1 flagellar hook-associated protein 1 FlgK [Tistlia consotensis USBA 355]SNR99437.1 flagellar hook-associated protein 1 FlgK [Tistlia consotensis]